MGKRPFSSGLGITDQHSTHGNATGSAYYAGSQKETRQSGELILKTGFPLGRPVFSSRRSSLAGQMPRHGMLYALGFGGHKRVRLPYSKPIHPKQDDCLKWSSNEKINGTPSVTAHRDMVDGSVDISWKKQYKYNGSNPSSESPSLWHKETDGDCELQDSSQIHEKHPFRNPGGQHLGHGFSLNEMSDTRENE